MSVFKSIAEAFPAAVLLDILKSFLTNKEVQARIAGTLAPPPRGLLFEVIGRLQEHDMIPNSDAEIAQQNFDDYHQMALERKFPGWSENGMIETMCELLNLDRRNEQGAFLDNHHNNAKYALFRLLVNTPDQFIRDLEKLRNEGLLAYVKAAAKVTGEFFKKAYEQAQQETEADRAMRKTAEDLKTGGLAFLKSQFDKLK